jgi:hypothetical protein
MIVYVPCHYKLRCVVPAPCNGNPCTLGTTPFGFSEETGASEEPDERCYVPADA